MYKGIFVLLSFLSLGSLTATAQTRKDKMDKLAKDPKTAENAAKADVYIHDKKKISDSISTTSATSPANSKKKKCNKARKS